MKSFNELNYYDMLEISAGASDFEIRQAYKDTLSIYSEDSSVTYSLFSDEERKQIMESIEKAFTTLIDKNTRHKYDRKLVLTGKAEESDLVKPEKQKLIPIFGERTHSGNVHSRKKIEERLKDSDIKELISSIHTKRLICGNDLKTLRQKMGIELEDIFEVTRISISVLKALEDDNFDKLPSGTYIQNFLKIYAEFLRLDPAITAEGYLKNISEKYGTPSLEDQEGTPLMMKSI